MAKPIALDFGPTALAGLEGEDAEFVALLVVLERGAWVFLAARLPSWTLFFTGVCKAEGHKSRHSIDPGTHSTQDRKLWLFLCCRFCETENLFARLVNLEHYATRLRFTLLAML